MGIMEIVLILGWGRGILGWGRGILALFVGLSCLLMILSMKCSICKEGVPVGEKAKKMLCGHGYHGDCIDTWLGSRNTWLGSRNTCPLCRFELPTDDPEYEEHYLY
ncbi:hypothetical protein IFM89_037597 [Coptis chinensis]|uniref:RING-type domain-containing protein n=1 Tax=Coptis chinensis TaxID=261450 RepID=A0A835HE21_9MAGN|nr:hypothetical protein IFM89_037597 [Coptis chinensis]